MLYHLVRVAALQSVFPQTELGTFMSLVKRDKERQLQELTMIVTGIRLFNKECGKGGEGIDDRKYTLIKIKINLDFREKSCESKHASTLQKKKKKKKKKKKEIKNVLFNLFSASYTK